MLKNEPIHPLHMDGGGSYQSLRFSSCCSRQDKVQKSILFHDLSDVRIIHRQHFQLACVNEHLTFRFILQIISLFISWFSACPSWSFAARIPQHCFLWKKAWFFFNLYCLTKFLLVRCYCHFFFRTSRTHTHTHTYTHVHTHTHTYAHKNAHTTSHLAIDSPPVLGHDWRPKVVFTESSFQI